MMQNKKNRQIEESKEKKIKRKLKHTHSKPFCCDLSK